MHNGLLELAGQRMGKSIGNVAPLHQVLDEYGRDAVVLYFCGAHYRQPIAFGAAQLAQAAATVAGIREAGRRLTRDPSPPDLRPLRDRFFAALADDYNTPQALAAAFDWIREANRREEAVGGADLREMLDVLGLADLLDDDAPAAPPEVVALAEERRAARAARDFVSADALRARVESLGWSIRDVDDGFELLPA
jgi:cysteinyl-tRNA synthetase